MCLQDNSLFQFPIFIWQDTAGQAHVKNKRTLEIPTEKIIRGNTKIGPVSEVKITKQCDRRGIAIKIDSMQKDGTQSWRVFSRRVDKYVTELSEENKKPIHFEEASSSTGQPVAMEQRQQLIPSSSSSSPLRIQQPKWKDISAVPKVVGDGCRRISKRTIRMLRHEGYPREDDGTIEWVKLSSIFHCEHLECKTWTEQARLNFLEKGNHKNIYQYCLDSSGNILYMRGIRGHSGGNNVDLPLQDTVEIPSSWIEYICHVPIIAISIIQSGMFAGGKEFKIRKTSRILHSIGSPERTKR